MDVPYATKLITMQMNSFDKMSTNSIIHLLSDLIAFEQKTDHQVSRYLPASELIEKIDLQLTPEGHDQSHIINCLQQYLTYTPKIHSRKFNKLLFSGIDEQAVLADWIASYSNTTMHTYQVAPVATLMERVLIEQLCQLIGFKNSDGIMVSGGSQANLVAMMLARYKHNPQIKENGFTGDKLIAYVSEQAHYSYKKAANILGIGLQHLIAVESDENARLCMASLETAIEKSLDQGHQPFFIGLTAGTTVTGAFDPFLSAHEIAKRYDLWLHIDGAWGGPVLFSERHKHLLKGSELADSFTWDAHKLMNIPLTASAILVNDAKLLHECCSGGGGEYLFHEDENAAYNLGSKSLQCGRRVDVLKFWISWKAKGHDGYAAKVDYLFELKDYLLQIIQNSAKLKLLAKADYLNILFRYEANHDLLLPQLNELNVQLCKTLMKEDIVYIDYANYKGQIGIRFILANERLTRQDLDDLIFQINRVGDGLSQELNK